MARQLFISQDTLVAWQDQDKVAFDGHVMTIKADGRRFNLLEAVRFIRLEGEGQDTAGMVGKVKTDEQIVAAGGERYRDSVILGEAAYKVQEGFIGEVFVRSGALDTGQTPIAPMTTLSGMAAVPAAPAPPAAPEPPVDTGSALEETVRQAAVRRAAAATAQASDQPGRAAVLRIPVQRRDLSAARTQPSLPVVAVDGPAAPARAPATPAATAAEPGAKPTAGKPDASSDEDLLTKFLLENL
ncbi:MAG TPA: hypothetical protein PK668_18410 [Myxococcota bacterium]|nr:hypothetical protein [Myxococcota bacterium]HRY95938.1 hypothetical protein [Myxococcota bacterium]HSA24269.1 hypothetical protein [Myxococcota bacterium]